MGNGWLSERNTSSMADRATPALVQNKELPLRRPLFERCALPRRAVHRCAVAFTTSCAERSSRSLDSLSTYPVFSARPDTMQSSEAPPEGLILRTTSAEQSQSGGWSLPVRLDLRQHSGVDCPCPPTYEDIMGTERG